TLPAPRIMTSNIGAELLRKEGSLGFKTPKGDVTYQDMKNQLLDEMKKAFKPEFLNRVDDVIVFRPLVREDLHKIVEIEIEQVRTRLKEQGVTIDLTAAAKEFLIDKGFDPLYGARPLRRTISRFLEDSLAQEIIAGRFKEGSSIVVDVEKDHLTFRLADAPAATPHA
ncbi:MAG: ATP-dependent Clp protease ATP-binding subunit, partial [Candidatus Omnitrophica bacterium]|nr:ATP-dependent Clp protease ATP-binding subunit [Candidatus Omnitrophota bacterium]